MREDERGGLTILMLVLLIGLILMTGVAMDLMRHESERASLQNALDRGVLSAASLSQTQDADATIAQYLATRPISGVETALQTANAGNANLRSVGAQASYQMDTLFLRLAGLNQLPVTARAGAIDGVQDVEISLVLDISGSMSREISAGTTETRLQTLRAAASGFIDQILTPETVDAISVSLVPYAGSVNAGLLFDTLATERVHDYSSCTEFVGADFNDLKLPSAKRSQVPHFQWFNFEGDNGNEAEWGWCPSDKQALIPVSNDPDALKDAIAGFVGHDGTGTNNGLKWGLALLDPSTQPLINELHFDRQIAAAEGVPPSELPPGANFPARPGAMDDPEIKKYVVLMTDGNIRYQQRPLPVYYNSASEIEFFAQNRLRSRWSTLQNNTVRNLNEGQRSGELRALCGLAKDAGITIFTIGFDVAADSSAFDDMQTCASTDGHFYHVQGLALDAAFDQIAGAIQQLHLTN